MNKKIKLGRIVAQVNGYRIRHRLVHRDRSGSKTGTGGFGVYAGKHLLTNFYISSKDKAIIEAEKLCK